jgi:hypothetical protein
MDLKLAALARQVPDGCDHVLAAIFEVDEPHDDAAAIEPGVPLDLWPHTVALLALRRTADEFLGVARDLN